MSKHTPAPWTVELDLASNNDIDVVAAELLPVASVTVREFPEDTGSVPRETALANATLIAAAPELLDACKTALDSLQAWNTMGLSKGAARMARETYEGSPEIKSIRAAIAKAEGRS